MHRLSVPRVAGIVRIGLFGAMSLALGSHAASAATITFDDLIDDFGTGVVVDTQYAGFQFSNTLALTAGLTLNEIDFPPYSGSVVASDAAGPITVVFSQSFNALSAFFTYAQRITLTAYDLSDVQIAQAVSLYASNLANGSGDAGSSPNELLQIVATGPIARLVIQGDAAGGSFTMDDFTARSAGVGIPEPASLLVVGMGLASLFVRARRRGRG